MKTIVVKTKKVVSQNSDMTPIYEEIKQSLSPEMTFNKFVKYLPNQNYVSVEVLEVSEQFEKTVKNSGGKDIFESWEVKKLDEVEKYQDIINKALKPKTKAGEAIDYKALSEKQADILKRMEERLAALESKGNGNRALLEDKANELNISFRANIGDDKLLSKIQEIEPEFNIN